MSTLLSLPSTDPVCVTQNSYVSSTQTTDNFSSLGVLQTFSTQSGNLLVSSTQTCSSPLQTYALYAFDILIMLLAGYASFAFFKKKFL